LQNNPEYSALDVPLVSIAFDSAEEQRESIDEYNITQTPMLVDADGSVSAAYDVLQYAVGTGEPGHTFVLVNAEGDIAWLKDYGSPNLAEPTMYVEPAEIADFVESNLN
jgi:peroxiredoxin